MQDILAILACITLGAALGVWRRNDAPLLRAADSASMYAIYGLLFILGARLGLDPAITASLPSLGARSLGISLCCTAGSVLAAMAADRLLPELVRPAAFAAERDARRPVAAKAEHAAATASAPPKTPPPPPPGPSPLLGSAKILLAFAGGATCSLFGFSPGWLARSGLATYAIYALVFAVGIGFGANLRALRVLRDMHVKILAVPVCIIAGTMCGALAASLALPGVSARDALGVGAGLGYYSLSSILIENAGNPALASMALLANILREITTILAAPLLARHCGRLATLAAAGATAMDSTLPAIARFSGERAAVIAVFSGMALTLAVPFLVAAALQW